MISLKYLSEQVGLESLRHRDGLWFRTKALAFVLCLEMLVAPGWVLCAQTQGLLREVFTEIPGESITLLTSHPKFPSKPDSTNLISSFEAPLDVLDNYGQRVRGYVVPPLTGSYTFWIASDDNSELWLSSDSNPAQRKLIASVATWTSSREWNKEQGQMSVPIHLAGSQPYYIEALMKEGGGGDNLAVRWQLPNGSIEEPIPAQRLLPFGIAFEPPRIAVEPSNVSGIEGESVRFSVSLHGVTPASFQWYRNEVAIPAANGSSYLTSPIALSENGHVYSVAVTNALGSILSKGAVLTVLPDTLPPTITNVVNTSSRLIRVEFSELVEPSSAANSAHYTLDGGVEVQAATLDQNGRSVHLAVSPVTLGRSYVLRVSAIADRASAPNFFVPGSQFVFVAREYVLEQIGTVFGGEIRHDGASVALRAVGGGVAGTADAFVFAYQIRNGDFDIQARLESMSHSDPWATAGLMVRHNLSDSSPFAAVFVAPGDVGVRFAFRGHSGETVTYQGYYPVNFPVSWIRIKRIGSTLVGFASHDAQTWFRLGSTMLTLSNETYFGMAAASRDESEPTVAVFQDITGTASSNETSVAPIFEPSGPSNRKTALVVSEIMYHPAPITDQRDLEFIEIHNSGGVDLDLTGFSVSGDIRFQVPKNTVIPAGGYALIVGSSDDFKAVYGEQISFLGSYDGALSNEGGVIELRDELSSVVWRTEFGSQYSWPLAADGWGPSLILSHPSYGESDFRAWSPSVESGGSPGRANLRITNHRPILRINEVFGDSSSPDQGFVEIFNTTTSPVALKDYELAVSRSASRFRFSQDLVLAPRSWFRLDAATLGYGIGNEKETFVLYGPSYPVVHDIFRLTGTPPGFSMGLYPDGIEVPLLMSNPTPGQANRPSHGGEVVFTEVMYNPISGLDQDEFVELANRSSAAIDLSGWRISGGIEFIFPNGYVVPTNGYVVIAKEASTLLRNYPGLSAAKVAGEFSGKLSNSGERLVISRPVEVPERMDDGSQRSKVVMVEVDTLSYGTGGQWGEWADGGGSSLERIDLHADSQDPANWSDSDESQKSQFTTIQHTGLLDHGRSEFGSDFQVTLQGMGECVLDDVEVFSGNGVNLVANPGFEGGGSGWVITGNHRNSKVVQGIGVGASRALVISTTGRGDTGANRIQSIISNKSSLIPGSTATLRAKVRWLKGHPEVLLRLRGNWIETAGSLLVPKNLGTPGERNSRAANNIGPSIADVTHGPLLPASGQKAYVTARVRDPDGVGSVVVKFRLDPSNTLQSVSMNDSGLLGDTIAGDGIYTAELPNQSTGVLVAYHIITSDRSASVASSRFPRLPTQECLIRWGETRMGGNLGAYRIWQVATNASFFANREPLANDGVSFTFVNNDNRVIHNASLRGKGSPFHGGSIGADYLFNFPKDNLFLGAADLPLVTVGNLGNDSTAQREQASFWIGRKMALPYLHRRYVHLVNNGNRQGTIYEDTQEPNRDYVEQFFSSDSEGDLHKIEDWFEFADDVRSFVNTDATLQKFTTQGGGFKLARYRWDWRKRAVNDSANDYSELFRLVNVVNSDAATYHTYVNDFVDIEEWMRVFALQHIVGNWDAYGHSRGKNSYVYKPEKGRWVVFPWDVDFALGLQSDGITADLFATNDPVVRRMYEHPPFLRAYWRAVRDACDGPLRSDAFGKFVSENYRYLSRNGINVNHPQEITAWVDGRRNYLESRLAAIDSGFAVTSHGSGVYTVATNQVILRGTAPVSAKRLLINGAEYPTDWLSPVQWQIKLGLESGLKRYVITAENSARESMVGLTAEIQFSNSMPQGDPEEFIVFTEIHYNPLHPGTGFVELFNRSSTATFDLSGWLIQGIDFQFPPGTLISPRSYLVVASDLNAFAQHYGLGIRPVGQFLGKLDNGGEVIRLVIPGIPPEEEIIVDEVFYDANEPWPSVADGEGPSLQLIDAAQDNSRPANWTTAPSGLPSTTPGLANSVSSQLDPFSKLWLNEISVLGSPDHRSPTGAVSPWIELFNSSSEEIALGRFFLSNTGTNLTLWKFPDHLSIAPRSYQIIWLDGLDLADTPVETHANFEPIIPSDGKSQTVYLSFYQNGVARVIDWLRYKSSSSHRTFGAYPEGQTFRTREFFKPTPGAANDPAIPNFSILINEWQPLNRTTYVDPSDGSFDDWFELYNYGKKAIDISGFYLTDDTNNPTKFEVPSGVVIQPGGHLLVWADEDTGQNSPQAPHLSLHTNFKLSASGEFIGLYGLDQALVHGIEFGTATADASYGGSPDGNLAGSNPLQLPTPGTSNPVNTTLGWPAMDLIPPVTLQEGEALQIQCSARSSDSPPRALVYHLLGEPDGLSINAVSGLIQWQTTELHGPQIYYITVIAEDDASPKRWVSQRVKVEVLEVPTPPRFKPLADLSVDEGFPIRLQIEVEDPDFPRSELEYTLTTGVPEGLSLDPQQGLLTWIPTEAQGGRTYTIGVAVREKSSPIPQDEGNFQIIVAKVENAPVFLPVPTLNIDEEKEFSFLIQAYDPDGIHSQLRYVLEEGAPSGASLNSETGIFTWLPSERAGPGLYSVRITAQEPGSDGLKTTNTLQLIVNEINRAPELDLGDVLLVRAGEAGLRRIVAFDPDLPSQELTYRMVGEVPDFVSFDSSAGVMLVDLTSLEMGATNVVEIGLEVVDNGVPPLVTRKSLKIVGSGFETLKITEFLTGSTNKPFQFIEIQNVTTVTQNLSHLKVRPLQFEFPSNLELPPGGFVVLANDRDQFRSRFGETSELAGIFAEALPRDRGVIQLVMEPSSGGSAVILDEVAYDRSTGWEVDILDIGASSQLIDAKQSNDIPANWRVVQTTGNGTPEIKIPFEGNWRFTSSSEPGTEDWTEANFVDSNWDIGSGLFYVETAPLPFANSTPLVLGAMKYRFRTNFELNELEEDTQVTLRTVLDDGMLLYLNGKETFRLGIPEGPVTDATSANRTVADAIVEGPFSITPDDVQVGRNQVAVEVHQVNSTSSDVVFGLELTIATPAYEIATPGRTNSISKQLIDFPQVRLGRFFPNGINGVTDASGAMDPFVEIINVGSRDLSLTGLALGFGPELQQQQQYVFPPDWTLKAGESKKVWLDGVAGLTDGELHAPRMPNSQVEHVVLRGLRYGKWVTLDAAAPWDQLVKLQLGTVSGKKGQLVSVPLHVQSGFEQIGEMSFRLRWNPAELEFSGIEPLMLENWSHTGAASSGELLITWRTSDQTHGSSVPADYPMAGFVFRVKSTMAGPSPVLVEPLTDNPAARIQVGGVAISVGLRAESGSIDVLAPSSISGTLLYYKGDTPIPGALMSISDSEAQLVDSGRTSAAGAFSLIPGEEIPLKIRPSNGPTETRSHGVSTIDILHLRRHILNITPLSNPFAFLAGDVSGNFSISTLDITWMRRLILGLANDFPAGAWRFVDADFEFVQPLNPWSYRSERSFLPGQPLVGHDFIGVKVGDVNGSWLPESLLPPSPPIELMKESGGGMLLFTEAPRQMNPSRVATILEVKGVSAISSLQTTLTWNPRVLKLLDVSSSTLAGFGPGNYGLALVEKGILSISWETPNGTFQSIGDNASLIDFTFEPLSLGPAVSPLKFASHPTPLEVTLDGTVSKVTTSDSELWIGEMRPQDAPLQIAVVGGELVFKFASWLGLSVSIEFTEQLGEASTPWKTITRIAGTGRSQEWRTEYVSSRQAYFRLRYDYGDTDSN